MTARSTRRGSRSRSSRPGRWRRSSRSTSAGPAGASWARRWRDWRSSCRRSSWCGPRRVLSPYGELAWMQGAFYGIGAAVIAIIGQGRRQAAPDELGRDRLLWAVVLVNAVVVAWTEAEILWVFVLSGVVVLAWRAWRAAQPHPVRRPLPSSRGGSSPDSTGRHRPRPWGRSSGSSPRPARRRVRQRSGHRAVPARRRRAGLRLAHRAAVPRRGGGRHDHAGAGGDHRGLHRLSGRRTAGWAPRRGRHVSADLSRGRARGALLPPRHGQSNTSRQPWTA